MPMEASPKSVVRLLGIAAMFSLLWVPITIPFRVAALALVAMIWTLIETKSLLPLGFGRQRLTATASWAIGIAVVVIVFGETVQPLIERMFGMKSDYSGYGALAGNAEAALRLFLFALLSAALGEEILFRGFLLHQLEEGFGANVVVRSVAIVASAVLFGFAHALQGVVGVLTTGLIGAVFAWSWFQSGRNLWALMLAHALIDAYGIGMLYLGRYA
jgi:uncharacterized protein